MQVHDLVPYLRETNGQHHNFGHNIHSFAFESDDEYDMRKRDIGTEMKKRLGIDVDPLTGVVATVCYLLQIGFSLLVLTMLTCRRQKPNTCSSTS